MSPQEATRLKRLEDFVQRLQLNSHIAKAAGSDGEDARVFGFGNPARLRDQGEQILAKAATTFDTADGLMALGEKQISDPTMMGTFSSYVTTGDLSSARRMLTEVGERQQLVKAVDSAQAALDTPLNEFDNRVGLSELTARFGGLERLLASLEARLDRLEQHPQAAPVMPGQTVVKASNVGRKRRTKEQVAADMMRQIDRYVDHPTQAGAISSLVQAGRFAEARPLLEAVKNSYETRKIHEEKKQWGK